MIFNKKILVLGVLAIGLLNSAMSATVLQCPKASDLSMDVKKMEAWPDFALIMPVNIENNWDIKIDDKRGATSYRTLLAGMPETALLTISIDDTHASKETCTYVPFTQDWSIVLTSKQPIDYTLFKDSSKFRNEPLFNDTGEVFTGTHLVCRASAGHPEDCYQ